jgi:hypothetical protein
MRGLWHNLLVKDGTIVRAEELLPVLLPDTWGHVTTSRIGNWVAIFLSYLFIRLQGEFLEEEVFVIWTLQH